MKRYGLVPGVLAMLAVAACGGGDPIDAEGTYDVAITNRDNGCNFQNWTVGQSTQGVSVVITQSGTHAVAEVQGLAGGYLMFAFGGNSFSGEVDGADLDLTLAGTRPQTTGNCTYTYDGEIKATLTGNALQGTLTYKSNGNNNSDCAAVACTSFQDFSGARPPR